MISLLSAPEMIVFYVGAGVCLVIGVLYGIFSK